MLGGRALGAPAAGSFGDAFGGAYAFGAMGLVALVSSGVLLALAAVKLRPRLAESFIQIQVTTTEPVLPQPSA